MAIDGQDPSMRGGMDNDKYKGEFTRSTAHDLIAQASDLSEAPIEDYFALLSGAVSAQGYTDMAAAIDMVSKTSMGSLLRGSYEPVVTYSSPETTRTMEAEPWARNTIAADISHLLVDLYDLKQGKRSDSQTDTIADIRLNDDMDKEFFVVLSRILAREPERLDAAHSKPLNVEDISNWNLTPEDREKGFVTLEGQPDKLVRFQEVVVDSTVPGFDLELWRHNRKGFIRGDETDQYKLGLRKKEQPTS